jgi:hypothetical protein
VRRHGVRSSRRRPRRSPSGSALSPLVR